MSEAKKMGRPTSYSPEKKKQAEEYITNYAKYEHPLPSVVGMAVILNVAKSTLYEWAKDEDKNFSNTLQQCNDYQEMTLLHKGLTGDFNSTITKLALANHGYSDKTDNTLSAPGGGPVQTDHFFEFVPVSSTNDPAEN